MRIKSAWLTTNRSCNNHCEWCYAKNASIRKSVMDFEKAKKAVDYLADMGVQKIVLIGGEPTMYPHFPELSAYIKSKKLTVSVATNGRKFKDKSFAKETVKSVHGINISIKATSEEDYIKYTKSKGLEEMTEGFHNLKELGFSPAVSYVIVNDDKDDFERLIHLLEAEEMTDVVLQFVKPTLQLEKSDEIMDIRKMGSFCEYIYKRLKNSCLNYTLEVSFPLCLIKKEILDLLIKEKRIVTCCHIQRGAGIILDTDFKVLPCNHFAGYPFTDQPLNLDDRDSIAKLWESDSVQRFRNKTRCFPAEACKTCEIWDLCGGGCFTRWLYIDPSAYIPNISQIH